MQAYVTNIEKQTLDNTYYRKVLYTGKALQLVVMTLKVGEDIPLEVHEDHDQFIRVEEGEARVIVDEKEHVLHDDDIVVIPAGAKHHVINASSEKELKLYTLYAPPEHAPGTVHQTKAEADAAEH